MATNIRNRGLGTHAHAAAGPNFLSLALETRNNIYRMFLVADKTLGSEKGKALDSEYGHDWAPAGEYHLDPTLLQVCRQMYEEGSRVLYGENTFGVQFYSVDISGTRVQYQWNWVARSLFMNFSFDDLPQSVRKCKKIEILVHTFAVDVQVIRRNVKKFCSEVLCNMPELYQISIRLIIDLSQQNGHLAVGPFGVLRNMRIVDLRGLPQPFALRLKELLHGNTRQVNVDAMWHSLQNYVKDPDICRFDLQQALKALQEWDYDMFSQIRSMIIAAYQVRMEDALFHVYDFDPQPGSHPPTIQDDFDTDTEEDDAESEPVDEADADAEEDDDDEPGLNMR